MQARAQCMMRGQTPTILEPLMSTLSRLLVAARTYVRTYVRVLHTIQFGLLLRPWDASRRPTDVSQYQSTAVRPLSCRSLDVRKTWFHHFGSRTVVAESVADPLPRPYHSSGFFSVITHRFAVSCCLSGYHRHESDGKGCSKLSLRFSDEICFMFCSLSEGRCPSADALFCCFRQMTVD